MKGSPGATVRLPQCHLVVTGGGKARASNSFPDLAVMGALCIGWPFFISRAYMYLAWYLSN